MLRPYQAERQRGLGLSPASHYNLNEDCGGAIEAIVGRHLDENLHMIRGWRNAEEFNACSQRLANQGNPDFPFRAERHERVPGR